MGTYSFQAVSASLTGPTGVIPSLGYGAATADEGITIVMTEDKNTMTIGSDGEVMHSLHAGKSGTVTIRILQTSPVHALLLAMYNAQSVSPRLWGKNIIVVGNSTNAELQTCREVAFKKRADAAFKKDGDKYEWAFDAGKIDGIAGVY